MEHDELAPGALVGEYRIELKVGEGGMAGVYAAFHPIIHRRVAIKVLNAEFTADEQALERFVLEAQAVNLIHHPNIVDVYAFGRLADGRSYLVMEYLVGRTLGHRLLHGPRLTIDESCHIMLGICDALEAAHAKGVVHRDLKPDNIFLVDEADGVHVKLLDFGIAKLLRVGDGLSHPTVAGMFMGTPGYAAPEQARGHAVDGRADLYALGVVAYEMFTDDLPFSAVDAVALIFKQIEEQLVPPSQLNPQLPVALNALVVSLMAVEPQNRPSLSVVRQILSASPVVAVRDTLSGAITGELVAEVTSRSFQRTQRWLLAALVVCSMGVSGWLLAGQRPGRRSLSVVRPQMQVATVTPAPSPAPPPQKITPPPPRTLHRRVVAAPKPAVAPASRDYVFDPFGMRK